EVGGDPRVFGVPCARFHEHNEAMVARFPSTLLASSTHDTKRGEDARARIAALSECPSRWAEAVRRWRAMNARHRTGAWPDAAMEYLLYQTLVGTYPIERERLRAFLLKAARE